MVRREADRARILAEVVQPQRLRVADQDAEDPPAARQLADRRVRLGVDPVVRKRSSCEPLPVDHAQRGVARAGELGGRLDEPLQERVERQLRGQRDACLDQRAQAIFARPDRVHGVQRIRVDVSSSLREPQRVRRTPDGSKSPCRHDWTDDSKEEP